MTPSFVVGDGGILTTSSYPISHAVFPLSRVFFYPNVVLFPNDPSSALVRGEVYDGIPFGAPCNAPDNAVAISTGDVAVFRHNNPTVRHSLWTNTNILYTGGTNSHDRKRFRRQHPGDSTHTFPVSQLLEVVQG
jgi:hypothetical protein